MFNIEYSIIKNKDDLHKENTRIKQVLKENGYQESITSKIFMRITNNHSLPESQELTQATEIQEEEIRMSINLPLVEGTSDLHKENTRIKQVLKENGYQESITNNIFRRITNNHSLPEPQQLTQATDIQEKEIKMSMNLSYVEGTNEKLRRILRSHKIRSKFYTEKIRRKLLIGKEG